MSYGASETDRGVAGLIRHGTVTAVDPATGRAKVTFGGESESTWLPWTSPGAGTVKLWSPLAVGEQVVVASPGGDTSQGVIVGSIFSTANGSPSGDGGEFKMTLGASSISITAAGITLSSNGSTIVLAAGGITLNGARIDLN